MGFFTTYIEQIKSVCQKYKILKMYAFGSVVTEKFRKDSDIDLIVHLENMSPEQKGEYILSLWDELENLFSRRVDLLTDQKISNPVLLKNIETNKKLIYDGENNKVFV